ncbi:MAG: endonuclease/exonuclease/phosphatase family protein [Desulfatiglandales bacterium]
MILRLMTLNLRFENERDIEHPWEKRKHIIRELILESQPDILGTQEGRLRQLAYLEMFLKDYEMKMPKRTLDPLSQYPTLFIKNRFWVKRSEEFWLSRTPSVHLSMDWDSAFPRMISWAHMGTGSLPEGIIVGVTHLDNKGVLARQRQAEIISRWAQGIDRTVILMGDFNEGAKGEVHRTFLEAGFFDTWEVLGGKEGIEAFSYHGFSGEGKLGRIDWILIRQTGSLQVRVLDGGFLKVKGDVYPSDHFPYTVSLKISPKTSVDQDGERV